MHLMIQCVFAREVWFAVLQWLGLQSFTPAPDAVIEHWWPALAAAVPTRKKKAVNGLVTLTARSIWLERNSRVFDHVDSAPAVVCARIRSEFELWTAAGLCGETRGSDQ